MMTVLSSDSGLSLTHLLDGLVTDAPVFPDIGIVGIATDSREVRPGYLFLARQGLQGHGLQHAAVAIEKGAVAVLWEPTEDAVVMQIADRLTVPAIAVPGLGRQLGFIADHFYASPSRQLHVTGVTGTDGKTSVTHFIAQALVNSGQACGLLGTLGYGVYGQLQPPTHTTPDPLRLQEELAILRDQRVEHVAMEVSSHALHQHRTAGVAFNTAVLTHLSRDHLDYHGSVEAYAEAKRRLFFSPDLECAVLNLNDDFGRQLAQSLKHRLRVIAYHARPEPLHEFNDWLALSELRHLPEGLALRIDSSHGEAQFQAALLGGFNAENLLAALGALLASGLPLDVAVRNLSAVKTVPGRMELFTQPGQPRVVVDYAHTPHALESALQALRSHCVGELICVFGAGGDRDTGKRAPMGAAAEKYADRVYLTSDNPRNENPDAILDQILAGFNAPQRALRIADRALAIETAIRNAAPDDLVLVAGKGHEDYQQTGTEKRPFSDRMQVQQMLRKPVA